ncbi:MAG: cupin domain-containing protein [Candidatus Micrarchaeaceae archaeon]|jgi:mannose-6-phosphate isomerase-like protein (cupin superfamily)
MKLVKKSERVAKSNSDKCTVYEYLLRDKDIDGAVAEITGREPKTGFECNKECKELCYVIKGSGILFVKNGSVKLSEGDVVLIQPGEKYYWNGKMTLFISCNPKWNANQHVFVK